jgi:SAM-dependent methyltransferase
MATYIKDECPVCGSAEYGVIGKITDKNPPVKIPEGSAVVKCGGCRLIYANPMPYWDSGDYAALYDESYFSHLKSDGQKKWLDKRENIIPAKRFGRIAKKINPGSKKMLEIGAGEYAFMCRYLIAKGWEASAQEPGESFAGKLRGIEGLSVETRGIKELDGSGLYSFIFADSVLEHVPDPGAYYKKLAELLAPDGLLYTVSPNEYSMYNFLHNRGRKRKGLTPHYIAPYTQPYHLLGFTKKSLKILGEKSGLRLISYKKSGDYMAFHALNSTRSALVKLPLALIYAVSQLLGKGTNGEAVFVKKS